MAASNNHLQVVQVLLGAGAKASVLDRDGWIPRQARRVNSSERWRRNNSLREGFDACGRFLVVAKVSSRQHKTVHRCPVLVLAYSDQNLHGEWKTIQRKKTMHETVFLARTSPEQATGTPGPLSVMMLAYYGVIK